MADASATCARIEADAKLPVSCNSDTVDGIPSIIVRFRNRQDSNQWMGPFVSLVGEPFCEAANRRAKTAQVFVTIETRQGRQVRHWSCELARWSNWRPAKTRETAENDFEESPSNMNEIIEACQSIQSDARLPITCQMQVVEEEPAMVVGFRSINEAAEYFLGVVHKVSRPFCKVSNRANRKAALFLTVANAHARRFDCEQGSWGEWFALAPSETPYEATITTTRL